MHKNFGEWYRLVALEPDGTRLAKRWAGVKARATAMRSSDESVLETVRLFRGFPPKTSSEPFLADFREQDPAFPQRNELELQVLAGASLVECIQTVGNEGEGLHTAIIADTALEASNLLVAEPRLDEIAREVATGMHAISVSRRKRRSVATDGIREKADAAVEAMKQIPTIANWDILKSVITPILQSLVDAVVAANDELTYAAHSLRSADEETNILWWVEGGCSRDMNEPWSALKEGAAVIAGTELADLTDVALGPRDASALLERVLSESKAKKDSTLSNHVNSLPDKWARELATKADERALDLTPLRLAISHRSNSDPTSWEQYFDSSSGMKSSTQLPAARAARQAYVEAILMRTLAGTDTEE
jgi:hypothetical protein